MDEERLEHDNREAEEDEEQEIFRKVCNPRYPSSTAEGLITEKIFGDRSCEVRLSEYGFWGFAGSNSHIPIIPFRRTWREAAKIPHCDKQVNQASDLPVEGF